MSNPFIREVNWFARALRSSLRTSGKSERLYDKALNNLRCDARDALRCPFGNVPAKSQKQLNTRFAEAKAGNLTPLEAAEQMASAHGAHLGPKVGTRQRAVLPGKGKHAAKLLGFDRAINTPAFLKYAMFDRERHALSNTLRLDRSLPFSRRFRPSGVTGLAGGTWWRLVLPEDPLPTDHSAPEWAKLMALPKKSVDGADPDGFVVIYLQLSDLRPGASLRFYKPNALSGFYEETPFLPELTGLPYGLTGGPNPQKEWVSASRPYKELLRPGVKCHYTYLPWNPRYIH